MKIGDIVRVQNKDGNFYKVINIYDEFMDILNIQTLVCITQVSQVGYMILSDDDKNLLLCRYRNAVTFLESSDSD